MSDARRDARELFLSPHEPARRAYGAAVASAAAHVQGAWQQRRAATDGARYEELQQRLAALEICPREGVGLENALEEVRQLVLPAMVAVGHPDYAAHLHSVPIIPALAAEVIIAATNQSLDSYDQAPSATAVEQNVIGWLSSALGLGPEADGVFTGGATKSNLMGLMLARDHYARSQLHLDLQQHGLPAQAAHWRILCSELAHFSVERAAAVLGLGESAVVRLPADARGVMRAETVRAALEAASWAGNRPIALVLTAGTTDLGSIDALAECGELAQQRGVWLHVDAAAGGAFALSETHRALLRGIERADSLAIDLHKLLFQPISCGVFLVRNASALSLLRRRIPYLDPNDGGPQAGPNLVAKSLETTRRFDALKVLVTLRALGRDRLARLLDLTVASARKAADVVSHSEDLELLARPMTNTVLLRWTGPGPRVHRARAEAVNRHLPYRLWRSGGPVVGTAVHRNLCAIKLTFTSPLHEDAQIERMLARLSDVAASLNSEFEREGTAP